MSKMLNFKSFLREYIEKSGKFFFVRSEKGKNLGKFTSKKAAKNRLRQIEYFKHAKK